ncbi:hypothetical protein D3C78_1790140 [compost metagenome]
MQAQKAHVAVALHGAIDAAAIHFPAGCAQSWQQLPAVIAGVDHQQATKIGGGFEHGIFLGAINLKNHRKQSVGALLDIR